MQQHSWRAVLVDNHLFDPHRDKLLPSLMCHETPLRLTQAIVLCALIAQAEYDTLYAVIPDHMTM